MGQSTDPVHAQLVIKDNFLSQVHAVTIEVDYGSAGQDWRLVIIHQMRELATAKIHWLDVFIRSPSISR